MTVTTESQPASRRRLWQIGVTVWLLLISGVVILDRVVISRTTAQNQTDTQGTRIATLEKALAAWTKRVDALEHQPAPVSQASLASTRQAIEDRIARIEQTETEHTVTSELVPLKSRLDQIEARLERKPETSTPSAAPARRPPSTQGAASGMVKPPFHLLGIELRGGERFLSIAPNDTSSLQKIHLLHPGETENGWQLVSLDAQTATFSFGGKEQRLNVPQQKP